MDIKKAKEMAVELMEKYSLLEDGGWQFQFSQARRQYGLCMLGKRIIKLSAPLTKLNSEESVRDTILHEIAHALVGRGHGHDRTWQTKAIEIGCNGQAKYGEEVRTPAKKYVGECPKCHHEYYRDKQRRCSCGKCTRKFNPDYLLVWRLNK